jgi:hypothetical protein
MLRASTILLVMAACGGGAASGGGGGSTPAPVATATSASLVGPLCQASACTCRDPKVEADGGAGLAPAGLKRFEFRFGPSQFTQSATIGDATLVKTDERPEQCFYLDLPAGEHALRLRAVRDGGAVANLRVSEYGVAGASWFKTFAFSCGEGSACSKDELAEQKAAYGAFRFGKHDPCGSTRVTGLRWDTITAPDNTHVSDLSVELTLKIYDFAPSRASGDPSCVGPDTDDSFVDQQ